MPSSVVAAMNYNSEKKLLTITFVSGLTYIYENVPENIYRAMKTSGSKGTYLNKHIKGHFPHKKINEKPVNQGAGKLEKRN